MNTEYRDGLLFTEMSLKWLGKTVNIDNVVIDTGASHSLISSDVAEFIGILYANGDKIVSMYGIGGQEFAFRKKIDGVFLGRKFTEGIELDFGYLGDDGINGLIGLDLLMASKAIIDLNKLEITFASN